MKNIIFCLFAFILSSCASSNPLIINAAGNGDISTVKHLHSTGQNINEKDYNGATPLMYAIWSGKADVAKYLIEAGADLKAKDNNDYDALLYAIDYKQNDIINLLLTKGVDIESKDSNGRTPLFHAVSNVTEANVFKRIASASNDLTPRDEAFEIVKMLIKKGANVNARDNESVLILEVALTMYNVNDVINELISSGANLFIPRPEKARLIFIGEDFFARDEAWITIGDVSKYLAKTSKLTFIDVNPGKHKIEIPVSWYQKEVNTYVNVEAGRTYYLEITQDVDRRTAATAGAFVGGWLGYVLVDSIAESSSEKGAFWFTPIDENIAKSKINSLLKTVKN